MIKYIIFSILFISSYASAGDDDSEKRSGLGSHFCPTTTITFKIPTEQHVRITLFNVKGEEVGIIFDSVMSGTMDIKLDSVYNVNVIPPMLPETTYVKIDSLENGVYFYRLIGEDFTETKKMMLLK